MPKQEGISANANRLFFRLGLKASPMYKGVGQWPCRRDCMAGSLCRRNGMTDRLKTLPLLLRWRTVRITIYMLFKNQRPGP